MRWKRRRQSHQELQDEELRTQKQAALAVLEAEARRGKLDLWFQDESGFCQWSDVGYGYFFVGEQKRQEQTKRRGKRLSVMGLWQRGVGFVYSLVWGGFKSDDFIEVMNHHAEQAREAFEREGKRRVIVLDNASIHTSKAVREKELQWRKCGLFLFFLPPYCSEMNPIELEWLHVKRGQLWGEVFESSKALKAAVVLGLESRAQRLGHTAEFLPVRQQATAPT